MPGAVGGWALALEAAKAAGGKLPLDVLLAPAIAQARNGYTVTRSQARLTQEHLDGLKDVPGFAPAFLVDGKPPAVGTVLKQEALAATLEQLAHAGLDDFYRGDVGARNRGRSRTHRQPAHRGKISSAIAPRLAEPLRIELPSGTVYNTDAPTQGVVSLMILALFARLGVTEAEGFDHIHGLVEATKRALRMRDRVVTDPNYLAHALDPRARRPLHRRRSDEDRSPQGGAVAARLRRRRYDLDGRRRRVGPRRLLYPIALLGIRLRLRAAGRPACLMQNRGASFSLDAGALNPLAPGRLPFHTLNPALAVLKDGRVMAYGAMGGDGQPQTQSAVFTRHVQFGEPLADAIDRPRWVLGRTWGAPQTALRLEPRFDGNLIDQLVSAGHDVEV